MAAIKGFVESPSRTKLHRFSKPELLEVAKQYNIALDTEEHKTKDSIKRKLFDVFAETGVLPPRTPVKNTSPTSPSAPHSPSETIRLRELDLEQRRLELETELAKQRLELERDRLKLEAEKSKNKTVFDVAKNIKLVPPFSETDVERYFPHFERVATNFAWPKDQWASLLQCVLTGKAQEIYSSLPVANSVIYADVKDAILRGYQLTPEAYRQTFRKLRKKADETYVEFGRKKETSFDRWCAVVKADDRAKLRELILLEEFINCLPPSVATHVSEQKPKTLSVACVLADEYTLIHQDRAYAKYRSSSPVSSNRSGTTSPSLPSDKPGCFYCSKPDHVIADCPKLKRKRARDATTKSAGLVHSLQPLQRCSDNVTTVDESLYEPFLLEGTVSVSGASPMPVRILRDTGANQTILLQGVLPLSARTATGSSVLVRGIGKGVSKMPLHRILLRSDLVSGEVTVAVHNSLPVPGVTLLLGNDIGRGNVFSCDAPLEVVTTPLVSDTPDQCEREHPDVFSANVVTRAQARKAVESKADPDVVLADTFMLKPEACVRLKEKGPKSKIVLDPAIPKLLHDGPDFSLSPSELIKQQKADDSLVTCFDSLCSDSEIGTVSEGFYLHNGVLMRKSEDCPSPILQIVVPSKYRSAILSMAHDGLAGHSGVGKTYDRIQRHFFWPGVRRDVAEFCRSCHPCQLAGKPNQIIPPAPLHPIPAVGQPFERVIIDCVGPLPRSKSGYQYLLTVMCTSTRYPEAIPLRKITTKAIVRALLRFFSFVGLPREIQSDQGSNFMSKAFAKALQSLQITHQVSSAFHPASQGALERYHQTLKRMLRAFCLETGASWEDAVPWLLFASREVVQESTGFSPAELVFAHQLRTPLTVLSERWIGVAPPKSLLQFVSDFRTRLYHARAIARANLDNAQNKMKHRFDRKARSRSFAAGDKVLVLMPIPGSVFQAKYRGPYSVEKKLSDVDYVIATPDKRFSSRVCHINMLKPYHTRAPRDSPVVLLSAVAESEDVDTAPLRCIVQGRLKNSEMLATLPNHLSHLTAKQQSDIVSLVHEYPEIFRDVPSRTNVLQHDIDVGSSLPIKQHPYRVNPTKRAILRQETDYLLSNKLAEPSVSPWSSPCLLVLKSDSSYRFCTDYRRVNAVTVPDSYPMPRVDDCVDRIGSATFVSKLDLLKGYWQVGLTPRARLISAFVTPDAFLQYNVMAFGMRNAGATFQRLVDLVLCLWWWVWCTL